MKQWEKACHSKDVNPAEFDDPTIWGYESIFGGRQSLFVPPEKPD